jgi:hypothetical protein
VTELEDAWATVHAALPAGWTVGPTSHHSEERHRPWHVVAVDLRSRALRKEYVEATGWTEAEALRELAALLGGWHVEEVEARFYLLLDVQRHDVLKRPGTSLSRNR